MAKQVQFRGGTTAEHSAFTGAEREITVDTDKNVPVIHDGVTPGGLPMATEAEVTKNTAVAGTDTLLRYDKQLANRDIVATEYDGESNLVVVRYTDDNDTDMYYRDVLEYGVDGLSVVKHYFGKTDLVTESAKTELFYTNSALTSTQYTEV